MMNKIKEDFFFKIFYAFCRKPLFKLICFLLSLSSFNMSPSCHCVVRKLENEKKNLKLNENFFFFIKKNLSDD